MRFSSLVLVNNNYIETGTVTFLCLVNLCLFIYQTTASDMLMPAAEPAANPDFQPTCIHVSRVLQSCRYAEQLTIQVFPTTPIPVAGPFPEIIPCGRFTVTAVPVVIGEQVAIILSITGTFVFQTAEGDYPVTAQAAAVVRYVNVIAPTQGTWHTEAAMACYSCVAIRSTARSHGRTLGNGSGRLSSLVRVTGNEIGVPANGEMHRPAGRLSWQALRSWVRRH